MKLFKLNGWDLEIDEIAYTLEPFKKIWDRDKSEGKFKSKQELSYIYFMEDPRSDYLSFPDPKDREKRIIEALGFNKGWKEDKVVKEAREFYASFKPESSKLLEDVKATINMVRSAMINFDDLKDVDPEKRAAAIERCIGISSKLMKLAKELEETERSIAAEITSSDKLRGQAQKSIFEDL